MAGKQGKKRWRELLLVFVLATVTLPAISTSVIPTRGQTYDTSTLQEAMEIPGSGVTRVCVVPQDKATRLKVVHRDGHGGTQEVAVKRKDLTKDMLHILEIQVRTSDETKPYLSVRLNETELPGKEQSQQTSSFTKLASLAPQQPRTSLMVKGLASITLCKTTPEARRQASQRDGEQGLTQGFKGETLTESILSSDSPSSTVASVNFTAEPDLVEEDPWWSFLFVLGEVGKVPVLVMLLGGVLLGGVLGAILFCACSKLCQKRRVIYQSVPLQNRPSVAASDIIRHTSFRDIGKRNSGIDSAFSTLTNPDTNSNMGTGGRRPASNNSSMDRTTRGTAYPGVNNLGTSQSGSPSSSTGRGRSNVNMLNITNSSGLTRYNNHGSASHPDNNRHANITSKLSHGSVRTSISGNKVTGSLSVHRNVNRSPSIPYSKTLGALTGHQETSFMKHSGAQNSDSDDSTYDKPYVSSPIVNENYSIPHSTQIVKLERPSNASQADPTKTTDWQTFLK